MANTKYPHQTVPRGRTGSRTLSRVFDNPAESKALLVQAAPTKAVAALLTTALAGNNNDITLTANLKGIAAHGITFQIVIAAGATAVTVVRKAITVTCATGTLASAVKAAIGANATANALVAVTYAGGNDGSGAVVAVVAAPLAGGVDGTAAPAETFIYNGGYLYFTPTEATVSTTTWMKSAQFAAL